MPDIEIGTIYFPSLPTDHPLRKLCEEEGFDMRLQDKVCKAFTASLQDFLNGLTEIRDEEFEEVASARDSSFRGAMLTDDGEALLLSTDATEPMDPSQIVGPDGETPL